MGRCRYAFDLSATGNGRCSERHCFKLDGFRALAREGIELASEFTATVDVQLSVGGLEETLTVRGESPVVDVQRTASRQALSRDVIDALPTGRGWSMVGVVVPGTVASRPFVGGLESIQQTYLRVHGSTGVMALFSSMV
jgi:hypothetical protein